MSSWNINVKWDEFQVANTLLCLGTTLKKLIRIVGFKFYFPQRGILWRLWEYSIHLSTTPQTYTVRLEQQNNHTLNNKSPYMLLMNAVDSFSYRSSSNRIFKTNACTWSRKANSHLIFRSFRLVYFARLCQYL